jgi:hypothetical protein
MNENRPLNSSDQEVDLSLIFTKMGLLDRVLRLFEGFFVPERKKWCLSYCSFWVQRLAILDKSRTAYDHEIIVMPNFGSTDYLYW